uniref:Uncharacterized protein n=1 Tax=Panagrolaimus sp. PS1159 TaxID=55785 RepID=A0AC35GBZ5_9BILA
MFKKFTRKFRKNKTKSKYRRFNSQTYLLSNISVQADENAFETSNENPKAAEKIDYQELLDKSYAPFSPFVLSLAEKEKEKIETFEKFAYCSDEFYERFIQLLSQSDYHKLLRTSSQMFKKCLEIRGIEVDELTIESTYQTNFPPITVNQNKLALYRCQKFIKSFLFPHIRVLNSLKLTIDNVIETSDFLELADSLAETYCNVYVKISSQQNISFLSTLIHSNIQSVEITIDESIKSWDELLLILNNVSQIRIYDWSAEKMDHFKFLKAKMKTWISCRSKPLKNFEFVFLPKNSEMNKMKKLYYCNGSFC